MPEQVPVTPPPIHTPLADPSGKANFLWANWFNYLRQKVTQAGNILWVQIDTTGSNLTDIETRNHNDLQNLQGGTAGEYYHLTSLELSTLLASSEVDLVIATEADHQLVIAPLGHTLSS